MFGGGPVVGQGGSGSCSGVVVRARRATMIP